ncbi:conserved hypothetical protein [Histoplasma capsulatum G186AR]|uniref:Uncharacterized protein n=2 Tax=Ajellomyces capsulatus TaxID=5037 RepID=C0ND31_AJECG|nr:uncharacterized protein HCBG_01027 [Histoplasma capsulatum G186AR]EEH11572.1 conserved hypothetical protein [Histoplasma capsulatum G186AR]KAG5302588.1 hypothetical protein I7I52_00276 [Histoplasma capsulatum]QSS72012.1 hypothetical protein I7I50_03058 [Histoplasma capsulatum G186AR]
MSPALPYLRGLRKSDLVVLAEVSNLQDFEDYKKTELEAALDDHLSTNRASLSSEQKLADYYRRLSQTSRSSPIKREPKTEPVMSGDDGRRPSRSRRTIKPKEEVEATDESDSSASKQSTPASRTPARRRSLHFPSLPPSPAVITDAIDRQTTKARQSMSEAWDASGLTERSDALRSCLSSVRTIELITLAMELCGLLSQIVPMRYLTTFPAVSTVGTPEYAVKVPDVFILLEASFWGPFSLWLSTSIFLPSVLAYFCNLSLKISQQGSSHAYGTRRTTSSAAAKAAEVGNFDPLVFNVSKALISYLVYTSNCTFWNMYRQMTVTTVSGAVPGGLPGLMTGAAIGTLGSLYEAILRR